MQKEFPDLGLVIDLTNTSKYYDATSMPVKHVKIITAGHKIPSLNVVQQFFQAVEMNKDGLIGVHCTHGVNRTGYLICRYLIQIMKWEPSEAIQEFEESRGHKFDRANYVADLMSAPWRND